MKRVASSILFPPHHQLSCGTAACAVKKHGRYEFRFTLRGSSTHCPIKKLRLRGSRLSRTYCSSAVRVFVVIIIVVVVIVIVISVAQKRLFIVVRFSSRVGSRGRNETDDGREERRVRRLGCSDRDVDAKKEVRPYGSGRMRMGRGGGDGR